MHSQPGNIHPDNPQAINEKANNNKILELTPFSGSKHALDYYINCSRKKANNKLLNKTHGHNNFCPSERRAI